MTPDVNKIKQILQEQFDLELLLKRREICLIQSEIEQGLDLLHRIKHSLHKKTPASSSKRGSTTAKSAANHTGSQHQTIYQRRLDGTFVRLVCPKCGRERFGSKTGFVNHARKVHRLDFPTNEDWIQHCGVPVSDEQVPQSDPCRKGQTIAKDMFKISSFQPIIKTSPSNDSYASSPSSLVQSENVFAIKEFDEPVLMEDDNPICYNLTPVVENSCNSDLDSSPIPEEVMNSSHSKKTFGRHLPETQCAKEVGSVNNDGTSRFYINKQIIVGNASKFIPEGKRDLTNASHKWIVYIRPKIDSACDEQPINHTDSPNATWLSQYIRKVTFFLHPSYAPDDVEEVTAEPFQIKKKGWGEFPIRIRLDFWDETRNKPVDLIHNMKMTTYQQGLETSGFEETINLEIDRQTELR